MTFLYSSASLLALLPLALLIAVAARGQPANSAAFEHEGFFFIPPGFTQEGNRIFMGSGRGWV